MGCQAPQKSARLCRGGIGDFSVKDAAAGNSWKEEGEHGSGIFGFLGHAGS